MNRQKEKHAFHFGFGARRPLARREREEERRFFFDGLLSTFIANINDVGSLLDNITSNINNRSLGEMYADGILHLEDESILDTEIPDILLDETDRPEEGETRPTLRNQTVTSLLGFTSKALEILNEFETSPIKAFQKYFPDAYDDLFPTNP